MKYSNIALEVLSAKECGLIKTNAQFWRNFSDKKLFLEGISNKEIVNKTAEMISRELNVSNDNGGFICAFDDDFPIINKKVKNNSEKPYLLFYRGDLSLLSDLNKNVAVIGLINPSKEIIEREKNVIESLVESDLVIVSGLASGCDTIAHETCLEKNGKTIAILPSQLDKVSPTENFNLAETITQNGGLVITEYYRDPSSKYEAISRFIERDRLQAMFSKAIILIASYRKGEGDSGSRHAMESAKKYETERYVMYNSNMDADCIMFNLNKDLINTNENIKVKILMPNSIQQIKLLINENLTVTAEQLTML